MVTFNHPLFLIVALAIAGGFLLASALWGRFQHLAISRFGRRQTLSHFSRFTPKLTTALVISLTLALLSVAAAEPMLASRENVSRRTLNAIVVMDVSRSMLAEDGWENRTRLETGIRAVERLLETYPDGRFGLVLYTSQVLAYAPTFDHDAIRIILRYYRENYASAIRGDGSIPADALRQAGDMIEELPYTVDVIFLISDGGSSRSTSIVQPRLPDILEKLRSLNIRFVAAGVGGLVPTTIPVYDENGELTGYHMFQDSIAYTSLDETTLSQMAGETSGYYLRLSDPDSLVDIAARENLDSQPTAQAAVDSLVWIPTAAAVLLILLWLVGNRISISRPRTPF